GPRTFQPPKQAKQPRTADGMSTSPRAGSGHRRIGAASVLSTERSPKRLTKSLIARLLRDQRKLIQHAEAEPPIAILRPSRTHVFRQHAIEPDEVLNIALAL